MKDSNKLQKALHKAILKALSPPDRSGTVKDIVADIADKNMVAQVGHEVPASAEPVLHKEMSVSEVHQQKQANAEAAVGMRPGQMKKVGFGAMVVNEADGMEGKEKGIAKLKKFMGKMNSKKLAKCR